MRNVHVWKSTTEEGEKREVRASKFSKEWKFQSKLKSEENWTYYDNPSMEDLEALHDILFRKYQRKRLAYDDVATVEKMIKERKALDAARSTPTAEGDQDDQAEE